MSNNHNPIIVFVRGLPGSGKSHLTNMLLKRLGQNQVIVLDPDATDYGSKEYQRHTAALSAEGVDKKLHAYRFLRAQAFGAIDQGKTIIWNQPFTNLEAFRKVVAKMKERAIENNKNLSLLIVEVDIDKATARKRVLERKAAGGHGPSDNTFNRFYDDYSSFNNEGIKTVSVHGSDNIDKSVDTVVAAIENL